VSGGSCADRTRLTMPPEWANLVLTSDIPHGERNVLVLDSLDVESYNFRLERWKGAVLKNELTDGGNGGDDLTKLELVENGGLTGGIETNLNCSSQSQKRSQRNEQYLPSEYL